MVEMKAGMKVVSSVAQKVVRLVDQMAELWAVRKAESKAAWWAE